MNKTEIRVTIDSKEKQQRAIEILNNHGEKIWEDNTAMYFDEIFYFLVCDKEKIDWFIRSLDDSRTEITLDQLDELLTKEKQK